MKLTAPTFLLSLLTTTTLASQNDTEPALLPNPTGPYATDIKALELTDHSRIDPYDPNHGPRKLMVSIFTPTVPAKKCSHWQAYPYAPPRTAELLEPLLEAFGWPNSTEYLKRLRLPICPSQRQSWREKQFPVVLFSHGLGAIRLASSSQAQAVAANGFVVITIDHPYDAAVIEYPDGSIVTGRNLTSSQELDGDVQTRSKDASFIIDELSNRQSILHQHCGPVAKSKVAMFGHSLGGASSVRAAYDDARILAAIDLDGSPYGFNTTGTTEADLAFHLPSMHTPFLLFDEPAFVDTAGLPTLYNAFTGWKRHLALEGSFHLTFTDLPLLVDTFGLRGTLPPAFEAIVGTIPGLRARDVVSEYVAAFMGKWLKGEDGGLLDGPSGEFPEVEFVAVG
ncbi:hypothetical protein M409DRAFT_58678 [Zasmidium cellare ATCC 36951]|uniref:1-alkyl-2-acetylglycerophosphocholine esterase n=1 Tax=Zasmidium cellare ATCC 36951 TaxID=1080233 RepID=A0A6A6C6L4_ZASCE|nr:uncharacterized protein M409DRAFT_58678 [Zasmidium cellare ATCC 36951]KAF2161898.1 hypothetical protein M409DRAFT_58678 [Zasmidium cellare ATCC 36951]